MLRRVELGSALVATALALIAITSVYGGLNTAGVVGVPGTESLREAALRETGAATILVIGIAIGAYFHSVYGYRPGLWLLWGSIVLLTIGIIAELLFYGPLSQMSLFLTATGPGWMTLTAIALLFAWIAAAASVTPAGWSTRSVEPASLDTP